MSSDLSEIKAYWANNPTLTALVPVESLYTGLLPPPNKLPAPPYAVLVPISTVPSFTTGAAYYSTFRYQISIYHPNPDTCESIAATVIDQFDYARIADDTISMERVNGPNLLVDQDTPRVMFHAYIEYDYLRNRQIGD